MENCNCKADLKIVAGLIEAYDNGNEKWAREETKKLPKHISTFFDQMTKKLDEWRGEYDI